MYRKKLQYLVKWKGYPNCVDWTWEPESTSNTLLKPSKPSISHTHKHLAISMPIFIPQIMKDNILSSYQDAFVHHGSNIDWEDGVSNDTTSD